MEKFIRIITDEPCTFNSSLCESLQYLFNGIDLSDKPFVMGLLESTNSVLHIPIKEHIPKHSANTYAQCITEVLNENGIHDFTLELSTGISTQLNENSLLDEPKEEEPEKIDIFAKTDYDVVSDLISFMRNDNSFYKKFYYPALHRVNKIFKSSKKLEFQKYFKSVINQAVVMYCSMYDTPEEPNELFGKEEKIAILDRIIKDETPQIKKHEYV